MFKGGIELSDSLGPCKDCVFRFNEMLHNPKPCNVCYDGSEYVLDDEETIKDSGWINDPETCGIIMNLIDEITYKVDCLNEILPNRGIDNVCLSSMCFLKALKDSIAEVMIKGFEQYGSPCYDGVDPCEMCMPSPGLHVECSNCDHLDKMDPGSCPF